MTLILEVEMVKVDHNVDNTNKRGFVGDKVRALVSGNMVMGGANPLASW